MQPSQLEWTEFMAAGAGFHSRLPVFEAVTRSSPGCYLDVIRRIRMAAFFLYLATVDDAVGHKSVCGGRMPARPLRPLRPVMPTLTHVANFLQVHVVHVEVNGFFTVSARHVPAGAGDHVENRPQRLQNLHVDHR